MYRIRNKQRLLAYIYLFHYIKEKNFYDNNGLSWENFKERLGVVTLFYCFNPTLAEGKQVIKILGELTKIEGFPGM